MRSWVQSDVYGHIHRQVRHIVRQGKVPVSGQIKVGPNHWVPVTYVNGKWHHHEAK